MSENSSNNLLTADQQSSLQLHMQELEAFVKWLAVSPEALYAEEAGEYSRQHPTQICSLLDERATPGYSSAVALDAQLIPAYIEDAVKYYPFTNKWEAKNDDLFPYLFVFFDCAMCGDSESIGYGCDNCYNGEIMFELTWDESKTVTAHKTL